MKFSLRKASDFDYRKEVEINSLGALEAIQKFFGERLIIDFDKQMIVIYDDFME